jgi:hypothetical protein
MLQAAKSWAPLAAWFVSVARPMAITLVFAGIVSSSSVAGGVIGTMTPGEYSGASDRGNRGEQDHCGGR